MESFGRYFAMCDKGNYGFNMNIKPEDVRSIKDVEKIIKEIFKGKKVKVFIFGSRARGEHTPRSDLDIGFLSEEDISYELSILREFLEESNLTFVVDIVDLNRTSKDFREAVMKEAKLWINLKNN